MVRLLGWVIGFDAKDGAVPLLLSQQQLLSNSVLAFLRKGRAAASRAKEKKADRFLCEASLFKWLLLPLAVLVHAAAAQQQQQGR